MTIYQTMAMSGVKTLKIRPLEPTHGQCLASVLAYLDHCPAVAWAHKMNTGAHVESGTDERGSKVRRFIRYGFPGLSDIIGQLRDGRFLAIEIKVKRDKLSPEQAAFLDQVNAAGGIAFVARSIEDARENLETKHGVPLDQDR